MKRLVFDSSGAEVLIGLWTSQGWKTGRWVPEDPAPQSKVLLSSIKEFLHGLSVSTREIDGIVVGQGPGSYTGLRIGITVAKTWSFAEKIPLYSFRSDELMSRTQSADSSARSMNLQILREEDLTKVEDLDSFSPLYANDHFENR